MTPSIPKVRTYGSPRAGVSLAAVCELRGEPVRESVRILLDGYQSDRPTLKSNQTLARSYRKSLPKMSRKIIPARAAWNLISGWIIARGSSECSQDFCLQDVESWFYGDALDSEQSFAARVSRDSLCEANRLLGSICFDAEFLDLLPYILEEHGPGSRASVMRDPTTTAARVAKRKGGVFYTPADVADYMVKHVCMLYGNTFLSAKVLDPACGTGVFLLAMLRFAAQQHREGFSRFDYIRTCLHGFDVSAHALDAAAFLLLHECLGEVLARGLNPCTAWDYIRRNLVEADALSIDTAGHGDMHSPLSLFSKQTTSLNELFAEIPDGFDILIGNPPYAALDELKDHALLGTKFSSLKEVKASQRANLFPLFVEMMWQLTNSDCSAAALVTPLSIAFHNGSQYTSCRQAMSSHGGQWQFAFFDREPHALFGEEVKTRNAILFRSENRKSHKRGQLATIETGPLRRWTSRTRSSLFESINFTQLGTVDFTSGIPKLSGTLQAEAFMRLRQRQDKFPALALHLGTCTPEEALRWDDSSRVFIGGTAYNFLNVYRQTNSLPDLNGAPLSESSVHCVEFSTDADASAAFAILSSRLVYWIWHVLGDGFHVAKWLFKAVPFNRDSFSRSDFDSLSSLGDVLWAKLKSHRFTSLNRGRQTIGFRPLACHEERNGIDVILAKAAGLDGKFPHELQRFVQNNVVVDSADERRSRVATYFTERSM